MAVFVGPSHLINSHFQGFSSLTWSFLSFISNTLPEMEPWPASTGRTRIKIGFLGMIYHSCGKQQITLFAMLRKSPFC